MTFISSPIPSYQPHFAGPTVAKQLAHAQDKYQAQIDEIDTQIALVEATFAAAFVLDDAAKQARNRIAALAKPARRIL